MPTTTQAQVSAAEKIASLRTIYINFIQAFTQELQYEHDIFFPVVTNKILDLYNNAISTFNIHNIDEFDKQKYEDLLPELNAVQMQITQEININFPNLQCDKTLSKTKLLMDCAQQFKDILLLSQKDKSEQQKYNEDQKKKYNILLSHLPNLLEKVSQYIHNCYEIIKPMENTAKSLKAAETQVQPCSKDDIKTSTTIANVDEKIKQNTTIANEVTNEVTNEVPNEVPNEVANEVTNETYHDNNANIFQDFIKYAELLNKEIPDQIKKSPDNINFIYDVCSHQATLKQFRNTWENQQITRYSEKKISIKQGTIEKHYYTIKHTNNKEIMISMLSLQQEKYLANSIKISLDIIIHLKHKNFTLVNIDINNPVHMKFATAMYLSLKQIGINLEYQGKDAEAFLQHMQITQHNPQYSTNCANKVKPA